MPPRRRQRSPRTITPEHVCHGPETSRMMSPAASGGHGCPPHPGSPGPAPGTTARILRSEIDRRSGGGRCRAAPPWRRTTSRVAPRLAPQQVRQGRLPGNVSAQLASCPGARLLGRRARKTSKKGAGVHGWTSRRQARSIFDRMVTRSRRRRVRPQIEEGHRLIPSPPGQDGRGAGRRRTLLDDRCPRGQRAGRARSGDADEQQGLLKIPSRMRPPRCVKRWRLQG